MGRISKFFGCPGDRPALHHKAPLIEHDREIVHQLKYNVVRIRHTNLNSSRDTLVSDNESADTVTTLEDDVSLSDASTKLNLADVLL